MTTKYRRGVLYTLQALGLLLVILGVVGDRDLDTADLRSIGLGVLIASPVWYFGTKRRRDVDSIYESGRQAGYEAGYNEGHAEGRRHPVPQIVRFEGVRAEQVERAVNGAQR